MKIFKASSLALIVLLAGFGLFNLLNLLSPSSTTLKTTPVSPSLNLTALAGWTPTPNAPNQVKEVVATAWPTPVTRIMPADREALRTIFTQKLTAEAINWDLLSSLSHAGVAWRCTDMKLLDISLPSSTSGTLVAVWATWYGGVDHSKLTVEVIDGPSLPPVVNLEKNTLDVYKKAQVHLHFPRFGLVGPEIQTGNEIALMVDKPSIIYGVWMTPREWLTGEDLLTQKQTDNINYALDWAKIDSIAPLNPDGSRDERYLKAIYQIALANLDPAKASVTLPDGQIVLTEHSLYRTLLEAAELASQKAGYAGVETLTITIDEPQSLSDYRYLSNEDLPIISSDLAQTMQNSTCPQASLPAETILSVTHVNVPNIVKDGFLKRLLPLYQPTP